MNNALENYLPKILNNPITRFALSDGKYMQIGIGGKFLRERHARKADDFYTKFEICSFSDWRIFFNSEVILDSQSLKSRESRKIDTIKLDQIVSICTNNYGDLNIYFENGLHVQFLKNAIDSVGLFFDEDKCVHEF